MKKYLSALAVLLTVFVANAQNVHLNWVKNMAASGAGSNDGQSIVTDPAGNVYVAGFFSGTVDFDPGAAVFNLTSAGNADIFVTKFDNDGNLIWAKKMGGWESDVAQSIAIDSAGNTYITGCFSGTVDFDPGAGSFNLTSAGSYDIFVVKLDPDGNFVWAKKMGGTEYDKGSAIAVDSLNNTYITGFFQGVADFDPGPDIYNMTSAGMSDIFVSKLDSNGNFVWVKKMGGTSDDQAYTMTLDRFGNLCTAGFFKGTADFDPGTGVMNFTSAGGFDCYVSKLDTAGNFIWAKDIGGTGNEHCFSIASDIDGNIYTAGSFSGISDFDPGPQSYNITALGLNDIFVSKLDSSGNFVWAKRMGGENDRVAFSIALDTAKSIYITGAFDGTTDFDPGDDTFNVGITGYNNIFVSKLDSNGNFAWAKMIASNGNDRGGAITVDSALNIYLTGHFSGTADFDLGPGVFDIDASASDIFVQKLSPCTFTYYNVDTETACGSYTWIDGVTYTESNETATYTLEALSGCDSIITLNLTITPISASTETAVICQGESYIFNGNTYTESNNTATDTFTNQYGCDSIVTLDLVVNPVTTSIQTVNICQGDDYTFNGVTYTVSNNTATDTFANQYGCDSVITLNLTVNPLPVPVISVAGNILAVPADFDSYQWLLNGADIPNATSNTYVAQVDGSYAVRVTDTNSCEGTSAAIQFTGTAVRDINMSSLVKIYPNPTKGIVNITAPVPVNITVLTVEGKNVGNYSHTRIISIKGLAAGLYFLKVADDKGRFIKMEKVVVQE